ncbi:antibiotic biosynthesis monooxygenase [Corynebacterium sp. 320]|uniref:Antibiotic biosynthesis monooxygenase n=1 Tax=Corynebacterium zhongnanshanii TaxID=2768834 RepID=A0ABQ6VFH4_9CORY|nr:MULTISPECIES: putative quinol monooxygenase [Corynebacterium]KAB1504083.1 antibiotic biosynthesis monooxygenase [Corynebacterium sp. 320]KAB1552819.1 antibiotic biosynthesis monooxygenase [Corynebacterium sp. 321]KAB1553963.1 antibiotic biosynthesis monooxygenase [Corynebacterium sp. 319]KAB3523063.1 antibiotic biosynthesis monooxygenase [Corynebacterium zhongnanshanii]KAB3528219.1 antibiotic biosynthesis monooxygenase [Corynebacterium sp. 250]
MILINVKFLPKPEFVDTFRQQVTEFTEATRAEEGCLWFNWYRSEENPNEYLLSEAFKDGHDVAHVESDHFKKACVDLPKLLLETPEIINTTIEGKTEWDRMAEFQV